MIKHKISVRSIFIAIVAWITVWAATQGLFMSDVLRNLPWDVNISYIVATVWVLTVAITALAALPKYKKISLPKSKLLWL